MDSSQQKPSLDTKYQNYEQLRSSGSAKSIIQESANYSAFDMSLITPRRPTLDIETELKEMDLELKSKNDLLGIIKRMLSEVNVKNKIIYDMQKQDNWLKAELRTIKSVNMNPDISQDRSDLLAEALTQVDTSDMDLSKLALVQTLFQFKKELEKARTQLDQDQKSLWELSKKQTLAEQELLYLRSIVAQPGKIEDAKDARLKDLEEQLRDTLEDLTSLQSKVSVWATASKRNQEGRLRAEAVQKSLQQELQMTKQALSKKQDSGLDGDSPSAASRQLFETQTKLKNTEAILENAQRRITDFEQTMREAYTTVDALEQDNEGLQKELKSKTAAYKEMEAKVLKLQEEAEELVRVNQELQQNIENLEAKGMENITSPKFDRLQNDNDELQEKLRVIMIDQQESQFVIEQLKEKNKRLLKRLSPDAITAEQAIDELENEKRALKSKIKSLEQQVQALNESREKELSLLENQVNSTKLEHISTKNQLKASRSELETARNELSRYQQYVSSVDELISLKRSVQLNDKGLKLPPGLMELENENNNLKAEIEELSRELEQTQDQMETYGIQLEDRTQDVSMLEERVEELKSTVLKLEGRLIDEKTSKLDEIARVQKETEDASKKAIENLQNDLKLLQSKLANYIENEKECELLKNQNRDYLNEIEQLEKEKNDFEAEVIELEGKIDELQALIDESSIEKKQLKNEDLESHALVNTEMEIELGKLREHVKTLEQENSRVTALKVEVEDLQVSIKKLSEQNEHLQKYSKELEDENDENQIQMDELEAKLERLSGDSQEKKDAMIRELEAKVTSLKEQLDDTVAKYEKMLQDSRASLTDNDSVRDAEKIIELTTKCAEQEESLMILREKEEYYERIEVELDLLRKDREQAELELSKLDSLIESEDKLKILLKEAQDKCAVFAAELDRAKANNETQLHDLKTELDKKETQIGELSLKIKVLTTKSIEMEQSLVDLNNDILKREAIIKEKESIIVDLREASAGTDDRESLEKQLAEKDQEILKMKKSIEEANANFAGENVSLLDQELKECRVEISRLVQDISGYKSQIVNYQEEIDTMKHNEQNLKQDSESQSLMVKEYMNTIGALKAELDNLKSETNNVQAEAKIKELEETNADLLFKISDLSSRLAQADAQRRATLDPSTRQLAELQSKCTESESKLKECQDQIYQLKKDLQSSFETIATLTLEKSRLNESLEDVQEENTALKAKIDNLNPQ